MHAMLTPHVAAAVLPPLWPTLRVLAAWLLLDVALVLAWARRPR